VVRQLGTRLNDQAGRYLVTMSVEWGMQTRPTVLHPVIVKLIIVEQKFSTGLSTANSASIDIQRTTVARRQKSGPIPTPPLPLEFVFLRCAPLPLKRLCQIKASLSKSSISFSVHCRVGSDCRNIIISWKSIFRSWSDHLTRKAAHT
jgi:hypothetical protein